MTQDKPKLQISQKALKKDLAKNKRPDHANVTFRLEKMLFEDFRRKAEKDGYNATKVLEAFMRSYLGT